MDSITQIALGACVGELVAGRKVGNKAALWGAVAGTIPDLDVLFGLFLDPVSYLYIHRGFTHSVFFSIIAAPLLAWLVHRIHQRDHATFKDWFWLFYLALLTHPILDLFTGYGTQFLYPITDYAFEWNTIFIIDPLYTVPLLVGVIAALRLPKSHPRRNRWAQIGLGISTAYLLLTVVFKWAAIPVFEKELDRQGIEYERMMTVPGPFSSLLWRALVETEDGYYQGFYSLLDASDRPVTFYFLPRNEEKIEEYKQTRAIQRLLWFSKGYYHVKQLDDGYLYFNDLRFGSYNGWQGDMTSFIFSFKLKYTSEDELTFEQVQMPVDASWSDVGSLWRRTFGRE